MKPSPFPKPDFDAFIANLTHRASPKRVFYSELYHDEDIKRALCGRFELNIPRGPLDATGQARRDSLLFSNLGYDLVRVHLPDSEFRMDVRSSADSGSELQRTSQGYIVHEHGGPIQNWEDLEKYPWQQIGALDTRPLEWAENNLPEGMKAYDLTSQFFEAATWLMGYESLFMNLFEEPELVEAMLERIGRIYIDYTRLLCQFDCIGVIWGTDDMGFKTQTLVDPEWIRRHILPLHKKAAEIAHSHGKMYFLHSCGQVENLMPDLINEVKIDAKHSFEDSVTPVTDFYDRWGGSIGVLGGLDIDFLSRATPDEVRKRTHQVLAHCQARGGYALGSGNSITNYVPLENYLAMMQAGLEFNG